MIYPLFLSFALALNAIYVNAKTAILVANQNVSSQEYNSILNLRHGLISAISYFEAEKGAISRTLIQESIELFENNQTAYNEKTQILIKNLTKGTLSPIHKNLLIKFYNEKHDLFSVSNAELQLNLFKKNPLNNPGALINIIKMIRDDDVLIINGFKLSFHELQNLKLHPKLYYHIAYLSNVFQPHFQFAIGEEIQNPPKVPILQGECEKSFVSGFDSTDSIMTLFPNNCMKIASHSEIPTIQVDNQNLHTLANSNNQLYWSRNQTWAVAGSLLIVGFIVQETKRQYDISFTLPF